jgi:UDPglucose--hexose-1-phosphate uridylyltransferase
MNLQDHPHRRWDPLKGEWILCSPHRTKRPWLGAVEKGAPASLPAYDPGCYLCPGNERAGGILNPDYRGAYAFPNDFPALLPEGPADSWESGGILRAEGERGACEVICFSPRHDMTLPLMSEEGVHAVVDAWVQADARLSSLPGIAYVQIFENRGAMMGCSNPHPHCQAWASSSVPGIPEREGALQAKHLAEKGSCLLCDYAALEAAARERIVAENDSFLALVPFWALWPFEAMILPKRHVASLSGLSPAERRGLAAMMRTLGIRYDNLFETDFPYSMGVHQAPVGGGAGEEAWHLHFHYYPPLLRSAVIRKFMVGYELLASPQRDISAETAAASLRAAPPVHFRAAKGGT